MRLIASIAMFTATLAVLPVSVLAAPAATPSKCYGVDLATAGVLGSDPKTYNYDVPNDGIENFVPVATAKQGLPESIQGIW